jgi:glutamine synthetase
MAATAKPKAKPRSPAAGEVRKVLDLIKQKNIQVVDVKFVDLPGTWQHFSIPAKGSASTGRRSGASRRSTRATCS